METLHETLIKLAHDENGGHIEYVDTFMNQWMNLREDESNINKMKQLVIFAGDLMVDVMSDETNEVCEWLRAYTTEQNNRLESVKTIDALEKLSEEYICEIFSILSKI